jgi:hypothetical protein
MVSTVRARRRGFTIGLVTVLGASALAAIFGLGVLTPVHGPPMTPPSRRRNTTPPARSVPLPATAR